MASSQKLAQLFVLLVVLVAFVTAEVKDKKLLPKNVILGYREPHDYLIQREEVKKEAQFLSYIKFDKTFVGDNHSIITQVRILDMDTEGNGAITKIVTAGPGNTFITVSFTSLLSGDINYVVEIYGKEPAESQ